MATLFQVVGYLSYLESVIYLYVVTRLSPHQYIISKEHGMHCSYQYVLFTRIFSLPIHLRVVLSLVLIVWMRYLLLRWWRYIRSTSLFTFDQSEKATSNCISWLFDQSEKAIPTAIPIPIRALIKWYFIYLIKWYFTLDHYNYSQWLTVHLFTMADCSPLHNGWLFTSSILLILNSNIPIYMKTFAKSISNLTKVALSFFFPDQLHEQNNEIIKSVGEAARLLNREAESALLRWELCGKEILNMISSFEKASTQLHLQKNLSIKTITKTPQPFD